MNRVPYPSTDALIAGAALASADQPSARKSLPRGTKLIRVGDQHIPLTRGDRKRVLRKLMSLKLAEGKDAELSTPAHHANRRSER